jgi:sugar/nucleoside kinase (ribokinase family)
MKPLSYNPDSLRYRALLGTGGIGTGTFFELNSNHTLGREESRSGHFLDHRDYCKLHIIAHFVKVLLDSPFPVFPIGKVGPDEAGQRLLQEMQEIGLDTRFVGVAQDAPTLTAICYLYPDGTGGNLTLDHSACDLVDKTAIDVAEPLFEQYRGKGIALAAPEVPLATRQYLLEKATAYSFYRVASFTMGEMDALRQSGILGMIDLLTLNLEETMALAQIERSDRTERAVVHQVVAWMHTQNPRLALSITAGKMGSWFWDGSGLHFAPSISFPAVSAAGAGDTHLACLIVAAALGMPTEAGAFLANLVAGISVTSPHTIHPYLDAALVKNTIWERGIQIPDSLCSYLEV